jgi:hypothetical protein
MDSACNRWVGFGVKSGGQLLIGGIESTTAMMLNPENMATFDLEIFSSRWGLGLGGSAGAVAVIAWGFSEPYDLHYKPMNEWGMNVSFTKKLIPQSVMKSLVFMKHWHHIYKNQRALNAFKHVQSAMNDAAKFSDFRDAMHVVFAGLELSSRTGVVVIDIPGLDAGLELSAFLTRGTIYVSNSSGKNFGN